MLLLLSLTYDPACAGVGVLRAVRVMVYPSAFSNLAVSSSPALDGAAAFFNYSAPTVSLVVASVLGNSTDSVLMAQSLLGPVRFRRASIPDSCDRLQPSLVLIAEHRT